MSLIGYSHRGTHSEPLSIFKTEGKTDRNIWIENYIRSDFACYSIFNAIILMRIWDCSHDIMIRKCTMHSQCFDIQLNCIWVCRISLILSQIVAFFIQINYFQTNFNGFYIHTKRNDSCELVQWHEQQIQRSSLNCNWNKALNEAFNKTEPYNGCTK